MPGVVARGERMRRCRAFRLAALAQRPDGGSAARPNCKGSRTARRDRDIPSGVSRGGPCSCGGGALATRDDGMRDAGARDAAGAGRFDSLRSLNDRAVAQRPARTARARARRAVIAASRAAWRTADLAVAARMPGWVRARDAGGGGAGWRDAGCAGSGCGTCGAFRLAALAQRPGWRAAARPNCKGSRAARRDRGIPSGVSYGRPCSCGAGCRGWWRGVSGCAGAGRFDSLRSLNDRTVAQRPARTARARARRAVIAAS